MNDRHIREFRKTVREYYQAYGRDLPWRHGPFEAYQILVSEIMLQQTQVVRVVPKYQEFLQLFPSVNTLAKASLADVLRVWNGLGYNRLPAVLDELRAEGLVTSKNKQYQLSS
jgi:A/G-specific adenine glycosylase